MYRFFLSLLIIDSLILLLVVLLQSGKGGGLSAEFGGASSSTDAFMGGRQAATLLTKASWVSGGIFIALALILTVLNARARGPSSILEGQFTPPSQQTQELPTPLLQQEEGQEDAGQDEGALPGQEGQGGQEEGASPPPEGGN